MKIHLAQSAGFCFGVKRAIDIALKTVASSKNVYMLGDIVHNEDVVRKIQLAGIKKIKKLAKGVGKILLIRAHGSSPEIFQKASRMGYQIFDATCPMVKEIHHIAKKMEEAGFQVIIIGDRKHDEVQGVAGQLTQEALIIDSATRLPVKKLRSIKKACVVVQSTQNFQEVQKIIVRIKAHIKNVKFFNTICRPTRLKQQEIRALPRKNDVMIIIGSKHSANTKRLFEISRSLNPRTYWVNSKNDIRKEWFVGAHSVGITAGASTPDETTQEIIRYLKTIRQA